MQANFTNKQSLNYKHPQQLDRSDLCSVQMNCGGGSNYFEMFGPNKTLSRIDLHFGYKNKNRELKYKYKCALIREDFPENITLSSLIRRSRE